MNSLLFTIEKIGPDSYDSNGLYLVRFTDPYIKVSLEEFVDYLCKENLHSGIRGGLYFRKNLFASVIHNVLDGPQTYDTWYSTYRIQDWRKRYKKNKKRIVRSVIAINRKSVGRWDYIIKFK